MEQASDCQMEHQNRAGPVRWPRFLYRGSLLWNRLRRSVRDRGILATSGRLARKSCDILRSHFSSAAPAHSGRPWRAVENEALELEQGDWVEVGSLEEIRATLDERGTHRGLAFTTEMEAFCGRRFRVFQRVELLYNEYTREQRRLKNTVLLEGVYCQGAAFGCDRSCFHFWREAWLRRVPPQDEEPARPSA